MNLTKPFITITFLLITLNANALNLGQILSGAGSVGKAWNEEEQRQLENQKLQLEVDRLNREAEIERFKFQKKLQDLPHSGAALNRELQSFQQELFTKLPMVIDQEISSLIESQYQRAIQILEENKDKLNQLADILIEKEVIFKDDLETIFGKRKFDSNLQEEMDL
jgi:ATP-dependent Zn protease